MSLPTFREQHGPNGYEIAWAAGFFDGEGSTILSRKAHENVAQLSLTVAQSGAPEALGRFRCAVGGIGTVRGPYRPRRAGSLDVYVFSAYGFERTQAIIAMLWPWLSTPKRQQATERLVSYRNEHWAFRAQDEVCSRGHHWKEGNWYTDSRGTKVCRLCRREDKRRALDPIRVREFKPRPSRHAERKMTDGQ